MQPGLAADVDTGNRRNAEPRPDETPARIRHDPSELPGWAQRLRTDPWFSILTIVIDIIAASGAVLLGQWSVAGDVTARNIALYSWIFVPLLLILLASRLLYRRNLSRSFFDDFEPMETSVAVATLVTMAIVIMLVPPLAANEPAGQYVRPSELMVKIWLFAAVLVPLLRLLRNMIQRHYRRKYHTTAPVLVIGSGPIAHQLIVRMRQVADYGLRPVGVLDTHRPTDAELIDVPYFGTPDSVDLAVRATGAEELLVAPSQVPDEQLTRAVKTAQSLGLQVRVVPRVMDAVSVGSFIEHLGGIPVMVLHHTDPKGWHFAVKHASDRVMAALGLLLISPVFLTLALLVKLSSPGPIFFGQDRIGRDGKVFQCLKFRSMRPADPSAAAFALKDGAAPGGVEGEDRRTWIGKIMRKTSLDELPQLVNVLRGDMSLVGPRPERPEFVDLFDIQIRRYGERHRVKAGMTGWAQVHGLRGQTSIADRAEFDNYYIENWSVRLDFKILVMTVLAVLRPGED
ncbi:sugar transferase [Mycobacterium sp. smrl_JER01]|uniref:sugar transferase n=1 Tax=Mycobacterium sp. smrl_JER01 TaxID=3402633 RepID=UPI003ACFE29A